MALDHTALASDIEAAVGAPGPTDEITGLAKGIVDYMKTGIVTFLPGTINGASPDGSDATGVGGTILLPPGGLSTLLSSVFPPTPEVIAMATAIETHLLTGIYSLSAGEITGACAGGVWTGTASGGSVLGYDGAILSPLIVTAVKAPGPTPEIDAMSAAIADHITNNMELSFTLVTGACGTPTPTGPAGAGAAGGIVS